MVFGTPMRYFFYIIEEVLFRIVLACMFRKRVIFFLIIIKMLHGNIINYSYKFIHQ